MFERWLGRSDPALIDERVDRYCALAADGHTVAADTREAVAFAAGLVPVAVVSAALRREIDAVVDGAGLRPHLSLVVSQDDVRRGKPEPECYLLAADRLGVPAGELLVFEDTDVGVAAAKAAGCRVAALTRTVGADRLRRRRRARRAHRRRDAGAVPVLVIAHRGASYDLPENTLPAFERAIEVGADYVEFDVWPDLSVTHDRPRRGVRYPSLAEVLDLCHGRIGVMVELKRPRGDVVERTLPSAARRRRAAVASSGARSRRRGRGGRGCGRCSTSASASASAAQPARGRSGSATTA